MTVHYDALATLRHFNTITHIIRVEKALRELFYCRPTINLLDKGFLEKAFRDFSKSLCVISDKDSRRLYEDDDDDDDDNENQATL